MPTPPIEVIIRMCPDSAKPIHGGIRPGWFSKEVCLASVVSAAHDYNGIFNITVLYDGDEAPQWLSNYINAYGNIAVKYISGRSGDTSFQAQIQYAIEHIKDDNTIVYILEDDYLHRKEWPSLLLDAFDPESMEPHTIVPAYVSLYDHLDKYYYSVYSELTSRIGISLTSHWRTIPSTTNSFACLMRTLREDAAIHFQFKNKDNEKFLYLGALKGRVILSPIPAGATHAEADLVSPCVKWDSVAKSVCKSCSYSN